MSENYEPVRKGRELDPELYDALRAAIGKDRTDWLDPEDLDEMTTEAFLLVVQKVDAARSEGWQDGYFEAGGLGGPV